MKLPVEFPSRAPALLSLVLILALAVSAPHAGGTSPASAQAAQPESSGQAGSSSEEAKAFLAEAKGNLRMLRRVSQALPRAPLSAEEFVAGFDSTDAELAADLTEWISENVEWLPYVGALRGPSGTLLERRAGTLDQALLLATALDARGVRVRLAQAHLPSETAMQLHAALLDADVAQRAMAKDESGDEAQEFLAACGVKAADLQEAIAEAQADGQAWLEDVVPASIKQAEDLALVLGKNGIKAADEDLASAELEALRHHTWVQVQEDTGPDGSPWLDFDPVAARAAVELSQAPDTTFVLAEVPADQEHRLTIRIVAERTGPAGIAQEVALETEYLARELTGSHMRIWFHPMTTPKAPTGDETEEELEEQRLAAALAEKEWLPTLQDVTYRGQTSVVRQKSILRSGEVNGSPILDTKAGKINDAAIGLSALGSAPTPETTTLSAVWIQYDFSVPGKKPYRIKRAVFDLLDPASRVAGPVTSTELDGDQLNERAVALCSIITLRPSNCDLTEEFLTREELFAATRNQSIFVQLAQRLVDESAEDPMDLVGRLSLLPGELSMLAHSRFRVGRHSSRVFLGQLNLASTHMRLFAADVTASEDSIEAEERKSPEFYFGQAIDIVENTVGVRATKEADAASAFAIRLEQGVLDTVLESTTSGGTSKGNSIVPTNTSRWAKTHPINTWALVTEGAEESHHPAASARVAHHLQAASHVAVAPPPIDGGLAPATFWSVDPISGTTLGIGSRGWGQDAPGTAIMEINAVRLVGPTRYYGLRAICLMLLATARVGWGVSDALVSSHGRLGYLTYARMLVNILSQSGSAAAASRAAFLRCIS